MIKYLFNDIKVNRKITVRKAENPNIKKLKGKKKNEEKKKVLWKNKIKGFWVGRAKMQHQKQKKKKKKNKVIFCY